MAKAQDEQIVWLAESTESQYSSIIESRHLVVFPWLVETILTRTPGSVLDYGAGDGRFLSQLRDRFGGELWYYDPSKILNIRAKRYLAQKGISFSSSPQSISPEGIDIVVSTAVWMTIDTYEGCVQYLKAQCRMLKPGGCALIAVTHPCFREEKYSSFSTNFSNEFYLKNGIMFEVSIFDENASVRFIDYHWSLSAMIHQANEAGFHLNSLSELPDTKSGSSRGTPWICFEFLKD